jgi:O-antigen biosynthesis protein WbqP
VTRLFDALLAAIGLILTAPILVLCLPIISLTSAGAAIFAQLRVGRGRRPFVCYKLRTMRIGTAWAATHEVLKSAVTPFGAFLRRTKNG